MNFDSILAVSDFSVQSAHVLERAALLARQHQKALQLIHLAEEPQTAPFFDPIARMELRARQLARRHGIAVQAFDQSASLDAVLTEARGTTLLVMGALPQRNRKWFYLGTVLDQAVYESACPLLVVKQAPSKPYERVLVAIDLSPLAEPLIHFAGRFSAATALKLFHAIGSIEDSKLRSVSVSPETIQANRLGSRLRAKARLTGIMDAMEASPPESQSHPVAFEVGNGDPAHSTARHQRSTQTELIVVGQGRSSLMARYFTRSVAQRLAESATADVLIVPIAQMSVATQSEELC